MNIKTLTLALAVLFIATNAGCRVSDSSASSRIQPSPQAEQQATAIGDCGAVAKDQQHPVQTVVRNPIRIVIFQDKSGSANDTRTVQLNEGGFAAPINLLRCTGGELGIGIVDDLSNRPLVRLRIDAPPAPPTPPQARNVFQRAEEDGDYQQRLNDYKDRVAKWTQETDRRVEAFLAQAGELLKQNPNAKRTNVWSAVSRADLYLNESDASWSSPTNRYAILNSDCQETAHTKPVQVKSGAQWIVVNGAGSTGVTEALKPERFENPTAAFEFIKARELGGK